MDLLIGIVVVAAIAAYLLKRRKATDITVPEPTQLRTDLWYGYYACEVGPDIDGRAQNQPLETRDHVNLFWESQFNARVDTINNIRFMAKPTVLDVMSQVMTRTATSGRNFHYREDAPELLKELFDELKNADVLRFVKVIYPVDEPNTNTTEVDLQKAIDAIKEVAADYPELCDVKLACIYAAAPETYECFDQFTYVGVDDYDEKSEILASGGCYQKLKSRLLPGQRTILMPGGAFGQDITPFVNFAHSNPEVAAIVPFCWLGRREAADRWVGIGDPANPVRTQYITAGLKLCGKT